MSESAAIQDPIACQLDSYGRRVRVALMDYLRTREPVRHLYRLVADYPERGGRMLRSSLCLAAAEAFGSDVDEAIAPAVAIELLHNAFLIHDDIEDGSLLRRGRPTLHEAHGVPLAINTGDTLCLLAMQSLADHEIQLGFSRSRYVEEDLRRAAFESVEGQALEIGWREDSATHLDDTDYLLMILKKTCWYTTVFPMRAGAQVASRTGLGVNDFVPLGFFMGAAFQIQDDLLNLVGDEARYGKELNGDIREGKRTLMVIHLLRSLPTTERQLFVEMLAKPIRDDEDIDWIRAKMDACGSIEYTQLVAHSLAGAALQEFSQTFAGISSSPGRDFIEGLCTWVISRS